MAKLPKELRNSRLAICWLGNAGDDQDDSNVERGEVDDEEFGDEDVDEAAVAKFKADMEQALNESFEAFRNRTIYPRLDVATLQAIEDDALDQAIADYVTIKLTGANTRSCRRR